MQKVTKAELEAFLAKTATLSETEIERDGEYAYENFLNLDGEEIACIAWKGGEQVNWMIAG